MIPFSTSAMDQILAREPKMAISGPFPGIFRRKIYKNPVSSSLVLSCLLTLYTAVMSFEILFPFRCV